MLSQAEHNSSYFRYSTIRFVSDSLREITIPVGVMIWNTENHEFIIRLPKNGERVDNVSFGEAAPYLKAAEAQILKWINVKELPYQSNTMDLLSEEWWNHLRKLMGFRVRFDEAKPINCFMPNDEVDALFEATVKPKLPYKKRLQRVDFAISHALGKQLSSRLTPHYKVAGYRGREVAVSKAFSVNNRLLVIDGVNLAAATAEEDADALTSKLLRIKESKNSSGITFAIGYIASPNGLNGEGVLKDWIEYKTESKLYDLTRQSGEFAVVVENSLSSLAKQNELALPLACHRPFLKD